MTLASDARKIFRAGLLAVAPERAVRRNLRRVGRTIRVGGRSLRLPTHGTVRVVAIGKAAGPMADAAVAAVRPVDSAIVVTPHGYPRPRGRFRVVYGEHPVPGRGSFRAGRALLEFVRESGPRDVVLFLISGGGSAVAESPVDPLSPSDISRTTELLLASGAPIGAMNAIRRHLSRIKGGRLAEATGEARFATLTLSDVVGDVPEDIASGPTVADPTTFRDALTAVRKYDLEPRLPRTVVDHLESGGRGRVPETPKPQDARFRAAPFVLVGSNALALRASSRAARALGYRPELVHRPITGDTGSAATRFARRLLEGAGDTRRALVGGGETTVRLGSRPGRGGRNLEFALRTARGIAGRPAVILSAGTDGIDGPTDAAGGWVDGGSWGRSRALGVDIPAALAHHASYEALERLGALLKTGPTGTNVMDLHIGLIEPMLIPSREGRRRRGGVPSNRRRPS